MPAKVDSTSNAYDVNVTSYIDVSQLTGRWLTNVIVDQCVDRPVLYATVSMTCVVCVVLVTLVGPMTNGMCCYIVWSVRSLRTPVHLMKSHAALVDALLSVIAAPLLATLATASLHHQQQQQQQQHQTSVDIDVVAYIESALLVVLGTVHVSTMVFVACERLFSVACPFSRSYRQARVTAAIISSWLMGLSVAGVFEYEQRLQHRQHPLQVAAVAGESGLVGNKQSSWGRMLSCKVLPIFITASVVLLIVFYTAIVALIVRRSRRRQRIKTQRTPMRCFSTKMNANHAKANAGRVRAGKVCSIGDRPSTSGSSVANHVQDHSCQREGAKRHSNDVSAIRRMAPVGRTFDHGIVCQRQLMNEDVDKMVTSSRGHRFARMKDDEDVTEMEYCPHRSDEVMTRSLSASVVNDRVRDQIVTSTKPSADEGVVPLAISTGSRTCQCRPRTASGADVRGSNGPAAAADAQALISVLHATEIFGAGGECTGFQLSRRATADRLAADSTNYGRSNIQLSRLPSNKNTHSAVEEFNSNSFSIPAAQLVSDTDTTKPTHLQQPRTVPRMSQSPRQRFHTTGDKQVRVTKWSGPVGVHVTAGTMRREMRAARRSAITVMTYISSWLMLVLVISYSNIQPQPSNPCVDEMLLLVAISVTLFCCAVVSPLVYMALNQQLRGEAIRRVTSFVSAASRMIRCLPKNL